MWHFSMQGLPTPEVTCRGRELLPPVFTITRTDHCRQRLPTSRTCPGLAAVALRSPSGLLFSVALAVSSCRSSGEDQRPEPGYSPVQRSVLSGLSSPRCREAIVRPVVSFQRTSPVAAIIYTERRSPWHHTRTGRHTGSRNSSLLYGAGAVHGSRREAYRCPYHEPR